MVPGKLLIAAAVLLFAATPDAGRPSADAVAHAVAESRAAYAEAHPVPTKQQKMAEIQKEMADTQTTMRRYTGTSSAAKVEKLYRKWQSLRSELAEVRRKYTPVTITRLDAFKTNDLKIGGVGRINDQADQCPVYCVRVIEPTIMLAYLESTVPSDTSSSDGGDAQRIRSPVFLLKGGDTSGAVAEQPIRGTYDVVVSGKHVFEDADGVTQTVFVVEVFDPDRTFE